MYLLRICCRSFFIAHSFCCLNYFTLLILQFNNPLVFYGSLAECFRTDWTVLRDRQVSLLQYSDLYNCQPTMASIKTQSSSLGNFSSTLSNFYPTSTRQQPITVFLFYTLSIYCHSLFSSWKLQFLLPSLPSHWLPPRAPLLSSYVPKLASLVRLVFCHQPSIYSPYFWVALALPGPSLHSTESSLPVDYQARTKRHFATESGK